MRCSPIRVHGAAQAGGFLSLPDVPEGFRQPVCHVRRTQIVFQYDGSEGPAIMIGTLDHPEDWPATWQHSGIESKVPWYTISDDLPQTRTEESEFLQEARRRNASRRDPTH